MSCLNRVWTNHRQSIITAGVVLGVSGITAFVNLRPLSIVFLTLLSFWIYKTRFANFKLQIPDNLRQAVQSVTTGVSNLRQNKPGTYLLLVSGALVFCACIGHIISGKWVVLAGFILAVLASTKYQIKIIKENVEANPQLWLSQTDHEIDEFIPVVDESNMQLLNRFGENADDSTMYSRSLAGSTPSPDDEVPAELLLASPDDLPEIGDGDSQDSDSGSSISDGLVLTKDTVTAHDQQLANEIRFKSGHFNGDSSSSDDDSITRGLSFNVAAAVGGHSEVDHSRQPLLNAAATATTLQFLGNVLSQAVTAQTTAGVVAQQQKKKPARRDSTSEEDSEFEILNTDDLDVDT